MKAPRYLNPDRHLDLAMDSLHPNEQAVEANDAASPPSDTPVNSLQVDVGRAMPPNDPAAVPLLNTAVTPPASGLAAEEVAGPGTRLAAGLHFVGNAWLRGPCSVAGQVDGNLTQADGASVAVVVTETGLVKGDISAQKISVMGRTEGILDAGQGEVALHDTASVHGLVRYGRIQVNGADLNATLERVAIQKPGT